MLLALCASFSIIFAEAERTEALEQVLVPNAVAGLQIFSSSTVRGTKSYTALVEAKALSALLILR